MESTVFTAILLPATLAFIMFGMGLSLTPSDFSRLLSAPKAVLLGLTGQLLLLPTLAFMLAINLNAPVDVAIGMMILAACPGGTTSNLFTHIARANLALSVTLTAITTVICVFTTPWLIQFSIDYFRQENAEHFSLLSTSIGLIVISLVPVSVGMIARHRFPNIAQRSEVIFRQLSMIFMVLIIAMVSFQEQDTLMAAFPDVFVYAIILNLLATGMGVLVARLGKLSSRDGITLGIEIGTQNGTMAILIALSFIQEPAYSVAAAVYGLLMYVGATLLVFLSKYQNRHAPANSIQ